MDSRLEEKGDKLCYLPKPPKEATQFAVAPLGMARAPLVLKRGMKKQGDGTVEKKLAQFLIKLSYYLPKHHG